MGILRRFRYPLCGLVVGVCVVGLAALVLSLPAQQQVIVKGHVQSVTVFGQEGFGTVETLIARIQTGEQLTDVQVATSHDMRVKALVAGDEVTLRCNGLFNECVLRELNNVRYQ